MAKDHPNAPLRVSYGKEKVVSSFCGLPVHATNKSHLCYDIDTLPGNSGSPIIGRGANDPKVWGYLESSYSVKAIHILGGSSNNYGQGLMNMDQWIKPLQQSSVSTVFT